MYVPDLIKVTLNESGAFGKTRLILDESGAFGRTRLIRINLFILFILILKES